MTAEHQRDFDRILRINTPDSEPNLRSEESPLLLEIPASISKLKQTDAVQATDWQNKIRAASQHYFKAGYTITDFILVAQPLPQAFYVLEKGNSEIRGHAG